MALSLMTVGLLSGCGSGSDSTPATVTPTLSGVAAVGFPIVGGAINVRCAAGSSLAPATTGNSGDWQLDITGQTLPCAVQVSGGTINGTANSTPYHSIATAAGTVNVTPLTDMMVANLAGTATPDVWFSGLSSTPAPLAAVSQSQVDGALSQLRTALPELTPLATLNPITTVFTPAPGNPADDMLAALATAITNSGGVTHASLLTNAAAATITPPAGFGAALTSAYAGTSSGGASAVPAIPMGVSATASGSSQINLNWVNISGATGYNLYRSTSANVQVVAGNKINATPIQAGPFQNTGLNASTAYYYKITAVNTAGESAASVEVSATTQAAGTGGACADPLGSGSFQLVDVNGGAFPASVSVGGQLTLHIATLSNPATSSYTVAFDTASTPVTVQPSAVNLTASTLTVTIPQGATGGVRITDTCANNSAYQTGVFQTAQAAPTAPVVTATAASATQINLSWNAVPGATRYRIYSSTTAGQSVQAMTPINAGALTTALTVSDTGLTTGLTYYYKVVAYNADSVSGPASTEVSATPSAASGGTLVGTQMGGSRQGVALTLTGTVSTVIGADSPGSADGTGLSAQLWEARGITSDGANLYFVQWHSVRKVVIATGVVSTLAGSGSAGSANGTGPTASFNSPFGITTDGTSLFVSDTANHMIRKVDIATGVVTTLAGTGTASFPSGSPTNGTGTAANFLSPQGITTDGTNLFVADTGNNLIRKIVIATGEVSTLAGGAVSVGPANGIGTAASFGQPTGITTDGTNLYVTDKLFDIIRKVVIATGEVTTLAGGSNPTIVGSSGYVDGTGATAMFSRPGPITTDGANLYVAETTNLTVRKIVIATGMVSTLAGVALSNGTTDGTGSAALFKKPAGITTDGISLYITDSTFNHKIRKLQ